MRQCGLALSVSAKLYGIKLCIRKALEGLELVERLCNTCMAVACQLQGKVGWGRGREGRKGRTEEGGKSEPC